MESANQTAIFHFFLQKSIIYTHFHKICARIAPCVLRKIYHKIKDNHNDFTAQCHKFLAKYSASYGFAFRGIHTLWNIRRSTLQRTQRKIANPQRLPLEMLGGGQIEVAEGWWETSSKDKQGGFIGAELGFGETSVYLQGGFSGTGISPNITIFGGYQWYFTDYPYFHLGLRIRGYLGSYHGADVSYYSWSTPHSVSAHSLQGGVEPAFIWDFLDYKKHTL